tara:strand:+ start:265 stop:378 length:114 start_codon:yes stop_codon:yes gene_type:complete
MGVTDLPETLDLIGFDFVDYSLLGLQTIACFSEKGMT